MALRIFISSHTYRSEFDQLKTLRAIPELESAPVFRPEDLSSMFRATIRQENHTYYAASIACFAPSKEKFEDFVENCRKRKICLASVEENIEWTPRQSTKSIVNAWRLARIDGAAAVGGQRNANRWKEKMKSSIEKAKTLWGLPSKEYSIKYIEDFAEISRGSIVKALGNRVPYQINYQAAQKRKKRRNAKR